MSRSRIAQLLRILKLEELLPRGNLVEITEGQARPILVAPEEVQSSLLNYVARSRP